MPRAPLIVTGFVVAAPLVWAVHLALDPGPFATGPAGLLAIAASAAAVLLGAAILVGRAPWSRPLAAAASAAGLALGAATPLDGGSAAGIALSGAALAGSLGPWLPGWLRRLPAAEAPPPAAALALGSAAAVPAVVAVVRSGGLSPADWALAGVAAAAALGLLRASAIGLWIARVALPAAGIAAGEVDLAPGGWAAAGAALAAGAAAWRPGVALSVRPLVPSTGNVTIPPELVDPGLLEAAGFDDRGRPKEERR